MDEDQQTKVNRIKSRLKEAFSVGEFSAYAKQKLVWWVEEHVDIFACKIQQLAGRVGFSSHGLETAMKLAFMTEFLNNISTELQQALAIETLTIRDLLTRERVLTKDMAKDMLATMQFPWSEGGVLFKAKPQTGITCYSCTNAEARVKWPETMQQDGPMGRAPEDHPRRSNASTAIRSATLPQDV